MGGSTIFSVPTCVTFRNILRDGTGDLQQCKAGWPSPDTLTWHGVCSLSTGVFNVSDKKSPFRYCPSCGEEVFTYSVQKEEGTEVRCSGCGFPLELEPSPAIQGLDCIVIADDDKLFRSVLADLLTERGFSINVIPCENGQEFIALASEMLRQELSIKLAILDIMMYPLDGTAAALALRALEKGLNVRQPTPVLFLSNVRSDDTLRRLIARCQPALYLNKGTDVAPDQLGPRLEKVVAYLLTHGQRRT